MFNLKKKKNPAKCFPEWVCHFAFPPVMYDSSGCSTVFPPLGFTSFSFFKKTIPVHRVLLIFFNLCQCYRWIKKLNLSICWSEVKVTQSCRTLHDPVDYTVHGILQARTLEWLACPFSRGSSQPRDRIQVSCIARGFFTSWATREAPVYVEC